ncbi:MAG: hypothetical protein HW421_3248 [Ignavibacteria bacterium]|nr:hypothetical protein [Ignavibacteria bacterium]
MKIKLFIFAALSLLALIFSNSIFAQNELLWTKTNYWGVKVFFNSTGSLIALPDFGPHAPILNPATGEILKTFYCVLDPSSKKFSRDGKIFAYASNDGLVLINTETLEQIRTSKIKEIYFDFSSDDKSIITAILNDRGFRINKYDINTDSLQSSFIYPFQPNYDEYWMNDFAVSPVVNNVAFKGGWKNYLSHSGGAYNKIINLDSNKIIGDFTCGGEYFKYLSNGILAAINSNTINFYDGQGKLIKILIDSVFQLYDFCFNETDNEIMTCGKSTGIKIWDFNTLQLKKLYKHSIFVEPVALIDYNKFNHILVTSGLYAFDYSIITDVPEPLKSIPNIEILPNPADNQVSIIIQQENIRNISLSLIDLNGIPLINKMYSNINSNSFNTSINTSNMPSGSLFVNLTIDGKQYTRQVNIIK